VAAHPRCASKYAAPCLAVRASCSCGHPRATCGAVSPRAVFWVVFGGLGSSDGTVQKRCALGRTCARRTASTSARDAEKRIPCSKQHFTSIRVKYVPCYTTLSRVPRGHSGVTRRSCRGVVRLNTCFFHGCAVDGRARVASWDDGYRLHHTRTKCHKHRVVRVVSICAITSPTSPSTFSTRAAFFARRDDMRH